MGTRILLLLFLNWIAHLTEPIITIFYHSISGRDMILFAGGLFLIGKSTTEIHERINVNETKVSKLRAATSFIWVLVQIAVLDIIFSLDSVITAIGMANHLLVMIAAIVTAVMVMLLFTEILNTFIKKNPTIQILALSFLILIGVFLIMESFGKHIDRNYIYFAMGFLLLVEVLNMKMRKVSDGSPVS
jgi:predicted tellurium resistance membrane protein TerC